MEFKIDTKPTYTHITPVTNHLDAKLTEAIRQKWNKLTESGSRNFIIDLHNCLDADNASFPELLLLHETSYENAYSLVFTNLQDNVMQQLKDHDMDLSINIAPTMAEAVDIISMEILERDLFNEES